MFGLPLPRIRLSLPRLNIGRNIGRIWEMLKLSRPAQFLGNLKSTIGDYIEVVVLLVLAPTILAFWNNFRQAISDPQQQQIVDALTIVVVLGIAVAAIGKVSSD